MLTIDIRTVLRANKSIGRRHPCCLHSRAGRPWQPSDRRPCATHVIALLQSRGRVCDRGSLLYSAVPVGASMAADGTTESQVGGATRQSPFMAWSPGCASCIRPSVWRRLAWLWRPTGDVEALRAINHSCVVLRSESTGNKRSGCAVC